MQDILYKPYTIRQGAHTLLNPNALPLLYKHIKSCLTSNEILELEDYKLQTYIVEFAQSLKEQLTLQQLTKFILEHIRSRRQFWHTARPIQEEQQKAKAIAQWHSDIVAMHREFKKDQPYVPMQYPTQPTLYTHSNIIYRSVPIHKVHMNIYLYMVKYLMQKNPQRDICARTMGQIAVYLLEQYSINKSGQCQEISDVILEDLQIEQFVSYCKLHHYNPVLSYLNTNILTILISIINNIPAQRHNSAMRHNDRLFALLNCRFLCRTELQQLALRAYDQIKQIKIPLMNKIETSCRMKTQKQYNNQVLQQYKQSLLHSHAVRTSVWSESDYKKFLSGLSQFLNVPTNNRKIASYMGAQISPEEVKKIKNIYLANMRQRIQKGIKGGRTRGKFLSKQDFIQKDIQQFNMKCFQKAKKKKRIRRKQSCGQDDQQQVQSQSQQIE